MLSCIEKSYQMNNAATDILSLCQWNLFPNVIVMVQLMGLSFLRAISFSCRIGPCYCMQLAYRSLRPHVYQVVCKQQGSCPIVV